MRDPMPVIPSIPALLADAGPTTGGGVRDALRRALPLRAADVLAAPGDGEPEPAGELARLVAHLQSTVTSYVRERRREGVPVERVIPEVKCLVREAESCEGWRDPADTLMAQVVRWSIQAYYDEPALQHVPRFY